MCEACRNKQVQANIKEIMDLGQKVAAEDGTTLYGKFFALAMGAGSLIVAAAAAANVSLEEQGKKREPVEKVTKEIMELIQKKIERSFEGVDQDKMNEQAKAQADAIVRGMAGTVH